MTTLSGTAPVVLVVDGPNLNLLGRREPAIYGHTSLDDIQASLRESGDRHGVVIEHVQSNSEGDLVTAVQSAEARVFGLIINPAAYAHTSIALRDAVAAIAVPTVEVHVTNVHAREEFRHHSFVSAVAEAVIVGAGADGYLFALDLLVRRHLVAASGRKDSAAA